MKKLLILSLSLLTVIFMASVAMAAEASLEGSVGVKFSNDPAAEKTGFSADPLEFDMIWSFEESYSDSITAGLDVKVDFDNDDKGAAGIQEDPKEYYAGQLGIADANAWINFDYGLYSITAFTHDKGAAGKEFGEFDLDRGPGAKVVAAPVDGLTVTALVNQGELESGAEGELVAADKGYGFLVGGEYAADVYTVGAGYQSQKGATDDAENKTALALFGSFDVMDNLTVKGEYGSRVLGETADDEAITAYLVNAKYSADALEVDGGYLMTEAGFDIIDYDEDGDDWLLRDGTKEGTITSSVLFVDASYALNNSLKVLGSLDLGLSAEDAAGNDLSDLMKDAGLGYSYKIGLANQLTDQLGVEGWFRSLGEKTLDIQEDGTTTEVDNFTPSQFGVTATYAFANDVDGKFEVNHGQEYSDDEAYTRFKAMVTAKF